MNITSYLKESSWKILLKDEFKKEYFIDLISILEKEYEKNLIYPSKNLVFNAFNLCPFNKLKVIIIGFDPYSNKDANGLAFSVDSSIKIPNSLKNIYDELYNDLKIDNDNKGDLTKWARQGILLLNNTLTIGKNRKYKHKEWKVFTNYIIELINEKKQNIVYLLFGVETHNKENLIDNKNNLIIKLSHPSPNSTIKTNFPFYGSKCFSKTNKYLKKYNIKNINWKI